MDAAQLDRSEQPGHLAGHPRRGLGSRRSRPDDLLLPGARSQRPRAEQSGGLGRLHLPPEREHGLDRPRSDPAFTWTDYPDPDRSDGLRRAPSAIPARPTTWHPSPARPRDARRSSPGRQSRARTATSSWSPRTRTSATSSTRGSRESRPTRRATASSRRRTATRRPASTGPFCPPTHADGSAALPIDLRTPANPAHFQKQSTPPTLLSPNSVQVFFDQPTFRWTPTLGARRYRIQVAADPTFGDPLDDVVTDATSYSSNTTYPADTVLYWRVRADDENLNGLTWSATGTFQKKLAAPVPSGVEPDLGRHAAGLGMEPDPGRLLVRPLGRLARRDAQGLRRLPHAGDLVPQDDRHGRLPLAGPRELPEADERRGLGPVLGDPVLHAHDRRAGEREDRQRPRPRPAQLGPAARREGVQGADRLEPPTSAESSSRVNRQHELRAADDLDQLHRAAGRSTGAWPRSTRIGTRATGRRSSRSGSSPSCASPSRASLRHKRRATINVRVVDGANRLLKSVLVRVTGAGVKVVGSAPTRSAA